MKTTLNKIRAHSPCVPGWEKLLRSLGKTSADDEPVDIAYIIDSNGLDDALWCLRAVDGEDRKIRLFAVWCARQVEHLNTDPRVKACNDTAEKFAYGDATSAEMAAARAAAGDAARAAARAAAWDAAWDAARAAARDAARDAARAAAGDAARDAQEKELRRICVAM